MYRLACKSQSYAWGRIGTQSLVGQLLVASGDSSLDPEKPYAELWMGTHPSAPSMVMADFSSSPSQQQQQQQQQEQQEQERPLSEVLKQEHKLAPSLPYLFKVLSINKALSIQAHPDKKLAERLHGNDPAHYPDPNHKPELVVALTPFEALCCFRPLDQIRWFLENVPEFAAAAPGSKQFLASTSSSSSSSLDPEQQRGVLKPFFASIYQLPASETAEIQQAFLKRLLEQSSEEGSTRQQQQQQQQQRAFSAFKKLHSQFPGDVGCWMVFVFNIVDLRPSEGLFLAANEPHAYISGDCVEIMAASDNVIRAGLTPKFKDTQTLVDSLTYGTDSLARARFSADSVEYVPPPNIPEFRLRKVVLSPSSKRELVLDRLHGPAIAIVISGQGTVVQSASSCSLAGGTGFRKLSRGDVIAIVDGVVQFSLGEGSQEEEFVIFLAQQRDLLYNDKSNASKI